MRHHDFDDLPSLTWSYLVALARSPGRNPTAEVPELSATAGGVRVDGAKLGAYRQVCGIPAGDDLPLAYPQVLATPLHGAIFADPAFPFPPLGMIHHHNVFTRHRAIPADAPLDLSARLVAGRDVARGVEFDLATTAEIDGEVVWESTLTALVRTKKKGPKEEKKAKGEKPALPRPERAIEIAIPEPTGRRYAAASGDYNPIHLHALVAKPFGFKRAIVQGMWSVARCLGELHDELPAGAVEATVTFRRPIPLPATVQMTVDHRDGGIDFGMRTGDGEKLYLEGRAKGR